MSKATLYGIETLSLKRQKELGIENSQALGKAGQSVYEIINGLILAEIEKGNLAWRQEWIPTEKKNFVSGKPYSGINLFLLGFSKGEYYLTKNQVKALGGEIKDSAGKNIICFWTREKTHTELIKDANGKVVNKIQTTEDLEYPILLYYEVYSENVITGIEFRKTPKTITSAEDIVENMPKKPQIKHGYNEAYYTESNDTVYMPYPEKFDNTASYYGTLFHELVHSTGHKTRVSRNLAACYVDEKARAHEELVAELGASYLCGNAGILFVTLKNSAAYLNGWQKKLISAAQKDNKFFFKAAAAAQKAAEFIKGGKLEGLGDVPSNGLKMQWIKVADLNIDTKRFQNRQEEFSKDSFNSIVNNFSWDKFDPPRVWKDENGKIWLISGHSRTAAVKHLKFEEMPVFFITASQLEAEDAKYEYNFLNTGEGLIAELRAFRNDVSKKLTVKEMKLKWKTKYNQYLDWQYLNPKENGLFIKFLAVENYENFPSIRTKAAWIGQLRNEFPEIGNEHERELFDYVFNIAPKIQKEQLLKLIRDIMLDRRLEGTHEGMALGLGKGKKGTATRRDMESANKMIETINSEISGWKTHRNKAITDAERIAVDYKVNALNMQLLEIQKEIKQMIKTQTSLLGIGKRKKK